jgi:hypothetical protein
VVAVGEAVFEAKVAPEIAVPVQPAAVYHWYVYRGVPVEIADDVIVADWPLSIVAGVGVTVGARSAEFAVTVVDAPVPETPVESFTV